MPQREHQLRVCIHRRGRQPEEGRDRVQDALFHAPQMELAHHPRYRADKVPHAELEGAAQPEQRRLVCAFDFKARHKRQLQKKHLQHACLRCVMMRPDPIVSSSDITAVACRDKYQTHSKQSAAHLFLVTFILRHL
jgi:hypothetical protein